MLESVVGIKEAIAFSKPDGILHRDRSSLD
jgi:hypothetical protein